jgi:hypothetical protein
MLMFGLMAVLPGVLIYAVSVQFVTKSIETWFDVRVEKALEAGLNLGRSALDSLLEDLALKGRPWRWNSTTVGKPAPTRAQSSARAAWRAIRGPVLTSGELLATASGELPPAAVATDRRAVAPGAASAAMR